MTRSISAFLMAVSLLAMLACSPTTETATPTEDVEAVIVQLERDWVAAIVNEDVPMLTGLLADDFVGTSPSAHIYYKTQALQDLASGTYLVESMNLDEVSARIYGDTAVAFTSQEEKSAYAGQDTSGHYHYTNVWINRDGAWQVVASHGSRYEQPH